MKPKKPTYYNQERQNQKLPQRLFPKKLQNNNTSWSTVANWYNDYLKDEDNYQHKVILPNLLRLLDINDKKINLLDLGCGQGFFIEKILENTKSDIFINGIDLSYELLKIAQDKFSNNKNISLKHTDAENLSHIKDVSIDKIYSVLALQNMKDVEKVISEVKRVLKKDGRCLFVINHPAFRIPKESDWFFDKVMKRQGRVIYNYMSDKKYVIDMNPGLTARGDKGQETISFHHPLQYFSKMFNKHDLAISRIEEWISHKKSEKGIKQEAEDKARKEIPMFMCLELVNIAK